MGDPELRSDEKILMRTPGVYVKSIPFEGILTNKRILLVDRATNLLPPKEIQLVTIKDTESGENAIRDPIIKISVLTKTGEKRQMIITFSRQTGGNRIKERDRWLKTIKEQSSSTFDQVIRKVIPGFEQSTKKPKRGSSPRIEIKQSPAVQPVPSAEKPSASKAQEGTPSVRKIIEIRPAPGEPVPEKTVAGPSSLQFGTYCSRCGNRVPEGSGFCNRCGSKIFVAGNEAPLVSGSAVKSTQPAEAREVKVIQKNVETSEPLIEPSEERIEPWVTIRQESVFSPDKAATGEQEETFGETDESSDSLRPFVFDSREPESVLPSEKLPAPSKPPGGTSFKPGKKTVIGIIAVIIVLAIVLGAFFLFPMIANNPVTPPANGASNTPPPTTHTPLPTIVKNSGSAVIPEKTPILTVKPTYPASPGNSPANAGF